MKTEFQRLKKRLTYKPLLDKIAQGDELSRNSKYEEAVAVYKEVLSELDNTFQYDTCELYRKIGNAYYNLKNRDLAADAYEKTLDYCTTNASIYHILGFLFYYSDNEKSIKYYSKGLSLKPKETSVSNICLTMLKSDKYRQKELKESIEFEINRYRPVVLQNDKPYEYTEPQDPKKKLNIGYLSSDFYCHAMMQFVLPLLEWHDKKKFNITLYSTSKKCDSTTERIKRTGIPIVDCSSMSNKRLAEKIHNDGIDILVDLGGYTHCRSFALFYKPAPLIMQYLGFVNTMGMKEVDYIFADEFTIPKDKAKYYTEKPLYLDTSMQRFDFSNPNTKLPDVTELPYEKNGYITFGSFNCPSKISDYTIYLWSKLLKNIPDSKLLIYRMQMTEKVIENFRKKFEKNGIGIDRLIFNNIPCKGLHFNAYSLCDIALDPTPFNGLTITTELISMGVPVISLAGEGMQSRGCARVNLALGLKDLVAENEDEYVLKAKKLAGDIKKLRHYRKNLRNILNKSFIRKDFAGFAKSVEKAYTEAWKNYCKTL